VPRVGSGAGRSPGSLVASVLGGVDGLGLGVPSPDHRDRDVGEEEREQSVELPLAEGEGEDPAGDGAEGGEQLERHPEAQVRHVALEIDRRRRAARHDDADEADPRGLTEGQVEAEREERDEEDPATETEEGAEDAGADPRPEIGRASCRERV
jgi:hypothetical protein